MMLVLDGQRRDVGMARIDKGMAMAIKAFAIIPRDVVAVRMHRLVTSSSNADNFVQVGDGDGHRFLLQKESPRMIIYNHCCNPPTLP